jgi:hypothetical protein
MTEAEWLSCADPQPMLEFLRGKASDRKLRLFACASCRRVWHMFDERARKAIGVAERYANGGAGRWERGWNRALAWPGVTWSQKKRGAEQMAAYLAVMWWGERGNAERIEVESLALRLERTMPPMDRPPIDGIEAAWLVSHLSGADWDEGLARLRYREASLRRLRGAGRGASGAACADLLRDLFGNPIRPITINSHWLTSNVLDLARTIYEERAFDRLPILADALMDAGCADEANLSHCRSEGPHVRGCWVVDLILGKK